MYFFTLFFSIAPLFLYMIHDTIQQSMDFFSGFWDFDPGAPYCMQYVILVFYIILHCVQIITLHRAQHFFL